MNDKRCGQHNTTVHPVQTTGVEATGRSPLPKDPQRRRRSIRLQGYDYTQAGWFVQRGKICRIITQTLN